MFQKWTGKEVLKFILCFAAFFVLVLLTQLPGFLSPLYWALCPVLGAFFAAGPITCVMHMKRGFGSACVLPLLWLLLYRCLGEMGMPLMWIWVIAAAIVAEIVHAIAGYGKRSSIRICVPIASLSAFGMLIPLYLQKAKFLDRAMAEMDAAYVAGLDRYGTTWMFVLVLVLALLLSTVSERITEKILKIKE